MEHDWAQGHVRELRFLPLDSAAAAFAENLIAAASRAVAVPCRFAAAAPPVPIPRIERRPQADADTLLASLEARAPEGAVLVGVTTHDIGHPVFTFFFGRARLGGRAVVVSTARLAPAFYGLSDEPAVTLRRAVREIVHELGHAAGLRHCDDLGCIMSFATNVERIDLRGAGFCARCRRALPRGFLRG